VTAVRFLALKRPSFEAVCPQHHTVSGLRVLRKSSSGEKKKNRVECRER